MIFRIWELILDLRQWEFRFLCEYIFDFLTPQIRGQSMRAVVLLSWLCREVNPFLKIGGWVEQTLGRLCFTALPSSLAKLLPESFRRQIGSNKEAAISERVSCLFCGGRKIKVIKAESPLWINNQATGSSVEEFLICCAIKLDYSFCENMTVYLTCVCNCSALNPRVATTETVLADVESTHCWDGHFIILCTICCLRVYS